MRKLSAIFVVLVACGGDDAPADAGLDSPPDTQSFDLSCAGNTAPTTAVDPIPLSGTATTFSLATMTSQPVDVANIRPFKIGTGQIGDTMTNATGDWSLSLVSAGVPIDAFLEATKAQHRSTRVVPASPLSATTTGFPVLLLSDADFALVIAAAQATQSPSNGTVAISIVDCAGKAVEGAVPSVKQAGMVVGQMFDASAIQKGLVFFFDVPQNATTTVSASLNGTSFRAHDIDVSASTSTLTTVKPGF